MADIKQTARSITGAVTDFASKLVANQKAKADKQRELDKKIAAAVQEAQEKEEIKQAVLAAKRKIKAKYAPAKKGMDSPNALGMFALPKPRMPKVDFP